MLLCAVCLPPNQQTLFFIGFTDILLGDMSDEDIWDEGKGGKTYDVQHPSRFCKATQRSEQVAHAFPELKGIKVRFAHALVHLLRTLTMRK